MIDSYCFMFALFHDNRSVVKESDGFDLDRNGRIHWEDYWTINHCEAWFNPLQSNTQGKDGYETVWVEHHKLGTPVLYDKSPLKNEISFDALFGSVWD